MGTDCRTGVSEANDAAASDRGEKYDLHLARSRTVWDRWSNHYGLSESDFEPMRETAIDHLDLQPGDRVLDIGCGPGVNFECIRHEIGEDGELVAIDYSPEMVENARQRVTEHGWNNIDVIQADATMADLGEDFDAAIATLSMSVMPDIHRAIRNVYRSLASGGTFIIFDLRTIPSGPARILNPLLWRFFYWFANWNPNGDTIDSLTAIFEQVKIVETYAAGAAYTARARKQ
ncbi:class I SAM-dependent methyltransferase [Natrinema sp. SYSU A 869]|uniref:class I SAM-dependent methyltransferase n=1 Tax=Natrinema sp. SYSU A 869 TaxID=2871694 RepID=UPI001CA3FC8B|nr:class I SAM-dependent methyltransferase [Natrinema sp. SYSU A 869]